MACNVMDDDRTPPIYRQERAFAHRTRSAGNEIAPVKRGWNIR